MIKILSILFVIMAIASAVDPSDEKSNEVEPKPPVNLDPALRKALLKAITDLEKETTTQEAATEAADVATEVNEILETGDEDDNNVADVTKSVVNYHSFVVNEPNVVQTESRSIPPLDGNSPIVVEDKVEARSEDIETKETINVAQSQSRNTQKEIFADESKAINKKPFSNIQKSVAQQPKQNIPVSTTPRPTVNEDGENIEKLEEVQVFQAPLVAAFTVHQDVNGLPKKVVPIYKQAVRAPIVPISSNFREQQQINQNHQVQTSPQNLQNVQSQEQKQTDSIQDRFNLQKQLEEKQKLLEQQLRELQQQQRQQEELFRQQQLLQQQTQQQNILAFEEQQRLKQQQFIQQSQIQQQNVVRVPDQPRPQASASVTFQPSISLPALQPLPGTVELQPPQKEPSDFLNSFRSQPQFTNVIPVAPSPHQQPPFERPLLSNFNQQNNLISQQLPIEKTFSGRFNPAQQSFQFQQQLPNDKSFLNFNTIPLQSPSSTRVFRHDSSSGNFGFNNPNSIFNPAAFLPQNSNNFRPQASRFRLDDHLKNLLIQSGLTGKSQEDLSIVSKVLSLNHGITPGGKVITENLQFIFGNGKRNDVPVRPRINN